MLERYFHGPTTVTEPDVGGVAELYIDRHALGW